MTSDRAKLKLVNELLRLAKQIVYDLLCGVCLAALLLAIAYCTLKYSSNP